MDIHKPKPWHGLGEFAREMGAVVLGILIALALEQGVEWGHERSQLDEARNALRAEIEENARAERIAMQEDRCYLKVLDLYIAWAKGGAKPEVPGLAIPYPRATVWDTAKSGAVTHMDLKERLSYALIYDQAENVDSLYLQQRTQGLAVRGYLALDTLTPVEGRDLIRTVSGYHTLLSGKLNQEMRYLRMANRMGIPAHPVSATEFPYLMRLCALVGVKPDPTPQPD